VCYWQSNITQWRTLLRSIPWTTLDPNFVAALIEEESKGNPA